MSARLAERIEPDAPPPVEAAVARGHVEDRVRHFARLRAAHRALTPSSLDPLGEADPAVIRSIRECLRALKAQVDQPEGLSRAELQRLDESIDGYQKALMAWVARLPLAQLRASLSSDTHAQRVEVSALLQICLESEAAPNRHLRTVDFLITLLSAGQRNGSWVIDLDPADLNDVIRARCAAAFRVGASAESQIIRRFQQAALQIASTEDAALLTREISAYKVEVASFYFVPPILRCIVGYNIAARNHFEERVCRGRQLDAEIDDDFGLFAPLQGDDPRAERPAGQGGLPAHEAPGVLAVQEAIRRRLIDDVTAEGPAERLAAALDLSWLEKADRGAFLDPQREGTPRLIRTTVVLGHLAMVLPEHEADFAALGIHESQLDVWICEQGDQVQREVNTLIRGNEYGDAIRLGEIKSRFLAAMKVVSRRRLGRPVTARSVTETFEHETISLLREYLERERQRLRPKMFHYLLGGGWRRTAALGGVGLAVGLLAFGEFLPSSDPRRIDELDARQASAISPVLASGYRDHATAQSMFIGTVSSRWHEMDRASRRSHAGVIRDRVLESGAAEVLLFDEERVLQAHWVDGRWTVKAWDD